MRCGYEPTAPLERTFSWLHEGQAEDPPEICPGYLCGLPPVIEVTHARLHWDRGQLRDWCEGPPSRSLMDAIETLESADNHATAWAMKNPPKRD